MQSKQSYKSVHEYMDALFKERNPSAEQIKEAKDEYRKLYQKHYREAYREKHVQITFRVSKDHYRELKTLAKERGIKVSTLAKKRTLKTDKTSNIKVKILLSELIDIIEEAMYQNRVLEQISVLKQLETIEESL